MSRLEPQVERVGIAKSNGMGLVVVFHRVRIHLSRKYRVWWVAGDPRFVDIDPVDFAGRFTVIESLVPEGVKTNGRTQGKLRSKSSGSLDSVGSAASITKDIVVDSVRPIIGGRQGG